MIKFINIFILLIPLFLASFFVFSRIKLHLVDKKLLNNSILISSLVPLVVFIVDYFILSENINLFNFQFLNIKNLSVSLSFSINKDNIIFLLFSSFIFTILALFLKLYFNKTKQFIFIKQRYSTFLILLFFTTYLFLLSNNLYCLGFFWVSEGIIALIFAYFDISKTSVKSNIARFHRITAIGDFALLYSCLILFKYSILSQGYISPQGLNFKEFNILASYTYGISNFLEFKICFICLITAIISKFIIYPITSYYSFLSNNSNIIYLPIFIINNIFGLFLFLQISDLFELFTNGIHISNIAIGVCLALSLIFLLFEKNIKIIFGYIISVVNSIFLIYYFSNDNIPLYYFLIFLLVILSLLTLILKNINNFPRRLFDKQTGFYPEKLNIIVFETIPRYVFVIFNFIDEKIIQNISKTIVILFNVFANFFAFYLTKFDKNKIIKYILIIFAIFTLIAIFITLFGDFKC